MSGFRSAKLVVQAAAQILEGDRWGAVFESEVNVARELLELALKMMPRPIIRSAVADLEVKP